MREWYDISPEISESLAVWPGDQVFRRDVSMDMKSGDHLGLSSITTTTHLGAHTDAPNHYHKDGQGIAERDLSLYMGLCQVIAVDVEAAERIYMKDIQGVEVLAPRVLFKTGSFPNPNHFNEDFNSLSPELIDHLHSRGVRLVGIDTPSIDPFSSKKLESHNQIYTHDMAILEGIVLEKVEPGMYQLISLPLKIKNADASPVRAVLVPVSFFD